MQTVIYTLLMEYCSPTKRTMAGLSFELMWALGLIFLGGMAYAVRGWRTLQVLLVIPTIITMVWTWLIPESMQWLCTNNRQHVAFKVCVRTARYNGNYGSIEEDHRYWLENIKNKEVSSNENFNRQNKKSLWDIFHDIFKTYCLRKHILIMAGTWFTVAMCYYGVLFFMPTLTGDRHLNFILGGIIEFFVYVTMYFVLAKFGRRKPSMIYFCVNGILLVIIAVCSTYKAKGKRIPLVH